MADVICDTRQQAGKHTHVDRWLEAHGVVYEYRKVDFGDYVRGDGRGNVSVDTKKDVQELATNLGSGHARFVRECERARAAGYRLVVLVEQHPEYNAAGPGAWVSGVCMRCPMRRQCSPRSPGRCQARRHKPMQGPQLAAIMGAMERRHGVRFEFCARRDTARRICELLGVPYAP